VLAFRHASVGTAIVLASLSFATLAQMARQCGASIGLCLRALEREASEAEAKAELMEALEGGVPKVRSRVHAVVE
jgi:hypothetical protein